MLNWRLTTSLGDQPGRRPTGVDCGKEEQRSDCSPPSEVGTREREGPSACLLLLVRLTDGPTSHFFQLD